MNLTTAYWNEFQIQNIAYKNIEEPNAFYFCTHKTDANNCAELVIKKIKQATSPSVWWFEKYNVAIP